MFVKYSKAGFLTWGWFAVFISFVEGERYLKLTFGFEDLFDWLELKEVYLSRVVE